MTWPRQSTARITMVSVAVFACAYVAYVMRTVSDVPLTTGAWTILIAKTLVELVASAYGIAFLVSSIAFLVMDEDRPVLMRALRRKPSVAIIYLCCDDADWSALESLTRLSYDGPLWLFIHDDSRSEQSRALVDRMAEQLADARPWEVEVLRRPVKSGGKAGAVNYVLERTAELHDYFLLCEDPEEWYGLVQADRTPRPAFRTVTEMFGEGEQRETARAIGAIALSTIAMAAAIAWLWARRQQRRFAAPPTVDLA